MFPYINVAAGVLTSFVAATLHEVAKHYIGNMLDDDKNKMLRRELEDKLKSLELKKNVKLVCGISSILPPDLLDLLENCFYEFEDIQNCTDSMDKNNKLSLILRAYIKYVDLICNEAGEEAQVRDEGGDSNTQDNEYYAANLLRCREDFKLKIVEELTSSTNKFGVSIIGMNGIGKTFLARAVAADQLITSNFHVITAPPQSSEVNRKSILAHIESKKAEYKDKKALILLDGMHRGVTKDWINFRSGYLSPESKVLITTLDSRVADDTGTSKHCLPLLSGEDCYLLIESLANANGNLNEMDCNAIKHNKGELVDICRGSPLLANQMGNHLAAQAKGYRRAEIREIIKLKNTWEVEELKRVLVDQELVSLLAQKPNLIRCLAYCSLFPLDHEFEKSDLVQFWMAEGFAPHSGDVSWMEGITKGYFEDLHSCSLFQTSASLPGQQPRYKLHRLFYDMALNVASRKFCQKHIGSSTSPTPEISDYTRHLSLRCEDGEEVNVRSLLTGLKELSSGLRTFLLFRRSGEKIKKNPTFFSGLTSLRVLDLRYTELKELRISKLKYLRYLDLSFTPVVKLPKLSTSPELQVLKLMYCKYLRNLPKDLIELTSLISLQVNTLHLARYSSGIGKLINLQRLDLFTVGVGNKEGFKITELKGLNKLRGSLRIKQLENVKTKDEAKEAMLLDKVMLEKLELEWTKSKTSFSAEQVLEGLQPPKNLSELKIINYCSAEFPGWLNDTEVCGLLESIHLEGCKALPSVGELELLKTLCLEAMLPADPPTVRQFPHVETLILCNMSELNQWIELAARCMPSLLKLQIEKCQELLILPHLSCLSLLELLEISWCTMLEELPTLPQSLKSLTINASEKLKQRYQTGGAEHPRIRDLRVAIDSIPVDTSEPDPANSIQGTPNEHQTTSLATCVSSPVP